MVAISSKGTANRSCSTKASRSAGASVWSTTSSARPTELARHRFVFGVAPVLATHDGIGQVRVQRFFAPRLARAQHVEAHTRHDRRQPAAEVLDLAGVGAAEPEPGFLDRVVRLVQRAEHPVGDAAQAGAIGLEALCQLLVSFIGHIPSSARVREE